MQLVERNVSILFIISSVFYSIKLAIVVKVMAWQHRGDKTLPVPMMANFYEAIWLH